MTRPSRVVFPLSTIGGAVVRGSPAPPPYIPRMNDAVGARRVATEEVSKRTLLSEAKAAWFSGDFERCVDLCSSIKSRSKQRVYEVALLNARALLRLQKPQEAETLLRNVLLTSGSLDASLTARMLLGIARIRCGDAKGGLPILARAEADSAEAHPAIRSEIAYAEALAHWALRDLGAAERALDRVDQHSDIITARAFELRAWCMTTRGDYRRAARQFIATLDALEICRAQDYAIKATCLQALMTFAAEMFDSHLHDEALDRLNDDRWTSGTKMQRYQVMFYRALFAEAAGKTQAAYELGHEADICAPTRGHRVAALVGRAGIARHANEFFAARMYVDRAQALFAKLDPRSLNEDERFSLLGLAEQLAHTDVSAAKAVYEEYAALDAPWIVLSLAGDRRLEAAETYVQALIAEGSGDSAGSIGGYRTAFRVFAEIGYVRRAAKAALRLAEITGDSKAIAFVRRTFPEGNWMTDRLSKRDLDTRCNGSPKLSPARREIIVMLCEGLSNNEIAQRRGSSPGTVRNMISQIYEMFGVSRRAALIRACYEQKLYPPSPPTAKEYRKS